MGQHQEREIFVYNISFAMVTSGIGAIINKPKNTNWKHAFVNGAWQGSVGGLLNYTAKKSLYFINKKQNDAYSFPAKILHAAGSSIIENAALYNKFLHNWTIDYGPVRLDYSVGKKLRARFLPQSIYAIYYASKYGKLNAAKSLISGVFVFETSNIFGQANSNGVSYGRAIGLDFNDPRFSNHKQLFAHELIHTFQYRDYQVLNTWLKPLEKKVKSKTLKTIFSKFIYFDVPWFWPFYELQGRYSSERYFKNFYEFEAQRFSTNNIVHFRN